MRSITVREANQNFSRYVAAVSMGEELVITKRGKEVVRMVPVLQPQPRSLGEVAGALRARLDRHALPEHMSPFVRDECYDD